MSQETKSSGNSTPVSVETCYGQIFTPMSDDLIANSLREYGEWAQTEINILLDFISLGDTIIDGGACFGTHARAFSDKVGVNGKVICFEPSSFNRSILQKNAAISPIKNITISAAALGEATGVGHMVSSANDNHGANRLVIDENGGEHTVDVVSLDDFLNTKINFIKLDLEGAELSALRGMSRILSMDHPIVFTEILDLATASPLMKHMIDLEYLCYGVNTPAFRENNFNQSKKDLFGGGTECGLLFIHESEVENYSSLLMNNALPRIETIDDILILLFQQPQYSAERLKGRPISKHYSIPISSYHQNITNEKLDKTTAELEAMREALECREIELSFAHSELLDIRSELSRTRNELSHTCQDFNNFLSAQASKVEALGAIVDQWYHLNSNLQRLARRVRAFPFGIYFKSKKHHRQTTRHLINFPDQSSKAKIYINDLRKQIDEKSLCGATVISHSQTASLSEHPIGYKAKILANLKPLDELASPILTTPQNIMVSAVALGERLSPNGKLLISFSHDNYLAVAGGTQLCIGLESNAAVEVGHDYLHVYPLNPMSGMANRSGSTALTIGISLNGTPLGVASYQTLLDLLRCRSGETHIIIHQLLGHVPEEIADVIRASGDAEPIFWLHDFFALCQSPHLLRNNVSFCNAPELGSMSCDICCYSNVRKTHLQRMQYLFEVASFRMIAPSEFIAEIFRTKFSLPYASISTIPHMKLAADQNKKMPTNVLRSMRIAFVGAAADHKGWPNFLKAFEKFGDSGEFVFYYFGTHKVSDRIVSVDVATTGNDPQAMIRALREHKIDVVIHISPTPETFSFSVHEALSAGASVVTNRSSGNAALVIEKSARGCVLASENDLLNAFENGTIQRVTEAARARRQVLTDKPIYSRMSIDLISPKVTV